MTEVKILIREPDGVVAEYYIKKDKPLVLKLDQFDVESEIEIELVTKQ